MLPVCFQRQAWAARSNLNLIAPRAPSSILLPARPHPSALAASNKLPPPCPICLTCMPPLAPQALKLVGGGAMEGEAYRSSNLANSLSVGAFPPASPNPSPELATTCLRRTQPAGPVCLPSPRPTHQLTSLAGHVRPPPPLTLPVYAARITLPAPYPTLFDSYAFPALPPGPHLKLHPSCCPCSQQQPLCLTFVHSPSLLPTQPATACPPMSHLLDLCTPNPHPRLYMYTQPATTCLPRIPAKRRRRRRTAFPTCSHSWTCTTEVRP